MHDWSFLADNSVNCIATSPPYYGQRDYGVRGQIGLEKSPQEYIRKLVKIFDEAKRVLVPTGSLWVNLGDTYWSGKGEPKGPDRKQKHRRFKRPQDGNISVQWCRPKQLLLIPHRFAIAMQSRGWTLRQDIVWRKILPAPDPVDDRSARTHEYLFHFVLARKYFYHRLVDGKPNSHAITSVWDINTERSKRAHQAMFPEALVEIPIKATLPIGGVFLDPFCGSGTSLAVAARSGAALAIGADLSQSALDAAIERLSAPPA